MLTNAAHDPANLWVVTDLDGTLLDHHYDWSAAIATLTWLKQIGISVIPCTSKTAEEVRRFRREAELDGPFATVRHVFRGEEAATEISELATASS